MANAFDNSSGLVHVYAGNGKGKTTAAAGLCVRAAGADKSVLFAQFLKGQPSSETGALQRLGIKVSRTDPVTKFVAAMSPQEYQDCADSCRQLFDMACAAMQDGVGLVVLDEILDAVSLGFVNEAELCRAIQNRGKQTEVVLTGRNPGTEVCRLADYITIMAAARHPYERGIHARKGIEF